MLPSSDVSRPSFDGSKPLPGGTTWLERNVVPVAAVLSKSPRIRALREALPISFGALLVALVVLVLFVNRTGDYVTRIRLEIAPAFAIMSIVFVFILANRLAKRMGLAYVHTTAASVLAFGFALPREAFHSFDAFGRILGTSGLFTAIVACLSAAGAISLANRRFGQYAGPVVGTVAIWIGSYALYALHLSIGGLLSAIVTPLGTLGDSFLALFLITLIETVLFLLGIHGPALLAALVLPVYLTLQLQNTYAHAHNEPLQHIVVVSTFLFVFPGGAGATLPLVLLMLRSRVPRLRKFAFATIGPSVFNTNEPVVFGLPLVYNPILGIPFVVAPLVLATTTYLAMAFHLVSLPIFWVPSPIPVVVAVFLATLDWRAPVLAIVNLLIAGVIWFPFLRIYEHSEMAQGEAAIVASAITVPT